MEAEDTTSEVEDRMVEINETWRKKNLKKWWRAKIPRASEPRNPKQKKSCNKFNKDLKNSIKTLKKKKE